MKPIILTVVLALSFSTAALAAEPAPCPEGQVCAVPVAAAPAPCGSEASCAVPKPCENPPCDGVIADNPKVWDEKGGGGGGVASANPANDPLAAPAAPDPWTNVVMGPPENVRPSAPPDKPAEPDVYRRHFGVQLTLGVPDAATLGIVYRPVKYVRGELGGNYNYLTGGVQVGVTALPFGRVLSFTGECGYFFGGNANGVTGKKPQPALDDMTYEYCNTHAGVDFGRERATFFIHAGMSYFNKYISNATQQVNAQGVSFTGDPHLTAWFPSAKVGLIVYFR